MIVTALNPRIFVLVINIFTSLFFYYTTNIRVFFDSTKFSDICLKLLTFISDSIFKPPWRLNGDGVIEGA